MSSSKYFKFHIDTEVIIECNVPGRAWDLKFQVETSMRRLCVHLLFGLLLLAGADCAPYINEITRGGTRRHHEIDTNMEEIAEQALAKRRKFDRQRKAAEKVKEGKATQDAKRTMQKQKRQSKRMADDNVLALEATCERQLLGGALSLKIAQITKSMQAWKKRKQSDVNMTEKGRQQKRLKKAKRHRVKGALSKSECLKERARKTDKSQIKCRGINVKTFR